MSNFFETFSPDEHETASYDVLPAGDYLAIVTAMEEKGTKKGDGSYLAASFQIIDGPAQGRMLWGNFNVNNPNPKAEEIGRRELADLCRAVGVTPKNSDELLNIPLVLKVAPDKDDPERNRIKGYRPAAKGQQPAVSKQKNSIAQLDGPPVTLPSPKADTNAPVERLAPAVAPAVKKSPWKK
jgi:hypothetical protein